MPTELVESSLHLWWIAALPLAGAVVNGLLGRRLPPTVVTWIGCGAAGAAFAVALRTAGRFLQLDAETPIIEDYFVWIESGSLTADFGFYYDHLTLIMTLVVTGVGFLIHIYSAGYMAGDAGIYRFFAYLNLFLASMLTLVMANNYLLMFVGWEGVGLCSYLLIGFYFLKKSAGDAGKKAFIVNRIGDFGFLLGMILLFWTFGVLDFETLFYMVGNLSATPGIDLTTITLLLLIGAVGKSAQVPLYVWLPDAMEGPTPVSALIHAATMVTAGVYMVARSHLLFLASPQKMDVVAVIGCITAFYAATIALTQKDINRVLAYSTISQLGFMFLACGVGAFSAAIFHLMTHAFFKALLFLGAGSVMHGLAGELDMRNMGGLRKKMPWTFYTFLVGTLALAGFPFFSGF
ncbi:MAG: NADH-quinone oxidoreductase subunit L, partial [Acidobacteria bacterium]|nr:NADH-quinone oxidoreductase subunit L [Acidobacteriota bacterium]